MFCMHVTGGHTGESGRLSKVNTGADGLVYSALPIGLLCACALLFLIGGEPYVTEFEDVVISFHMNVEVQI